MRPATPAPDPPVSPARSAMMKRIRGKDTSPERAVRSALHKAGFRFRLHSKALPGTPDIVLPSRRAVVFVHGCFWHHHPGCRAAYTPTTRRDYWEPKLAANVARDQRNAAALAREGWAVHTVWECETKKGGGFLSDLLAFLAANPPQARAKR